METNRLDKQSANQKTDATFKSLFDGWRDPVLRRTEASGAVVQEEGVPLRAMVAYLFGEVAKNFYLIHNPGQWIDCVTRSQRGDCCFEFPMNQFPSPEEMMVELEWERGTKGPQTLDRWMERFGAKPFDYNRGLDDISLSAKNPPEFHMLEGSNFFRGLALIDLANAMLKKAFGHDAIAVRVNAAGQGDYFQVHLDRQKADPARVKEFIQKAFYRRFSLSPDHDFVEVHSGGGAAGVRLNRYDSIPQLIQLLRTPR
jgi:hypothetical protein